MNPEILNPIPLTAARKPASFQEHRSYSGLLWDHIENGPYLSEGVGGYYVFEADSMEDAIVMAAKIPAARLGGSIEIRPTEKYW